GHPRDPRPGQEDGGTGAQAGRDGGRVPGQADGTVAQMERAEEDRASGALTYPGGPARCGQVSSRAAMAVAAVARSLLRSRAPRFSALDYCPLAIIPWLLPTARPFRPASCLPAAGLGPAPGPQCAGSAAGTWRWRRAGPVRDQPSDSGPR